MKTLLIIFIMIAVFCVGAYFADRLDIPIEAKSLRSPSSVTLDSGKLFNLVNAWRTENGYGAYTKNNLTCFVSEKRLSEIKIDFSHRGFTYERFCDNCTLAENLVQGYSTEKETLAAWIKSPSHYENLIKDYKYSCITCSGSYCQETFSNF